MVLGCRGVRGGRQEMGVNYDRSPSPPVQSCLDYLSAAKQTAREREREWWKTKPLLLPSTPRFSTLYSTEFTERPMFSCRNIKPWLWLMEIWTYCLLQFLCSGDCLIKKNWNSLLSKKGLCGFYLHFRPSFGTPWKSKNIKGMFLPYSSHLLTHLPLKTRLKFFCNRGFKFFNFLPFDYFQQKLKVSTKILTFFKKDQNTHLFFFLLFPSNLYSQHNSSAPFLQPINSLSTFATWVISWPIKRSTRSLLCFRPAAHWNLFVQKYREILYFSASNKLHFFARIELRIQKEKDLE